MGIPPLPFIGRAPNLNARGAFFRSLAFCHCLLPFLGVKGAKPLASPGVDKRSLYVHRVGWLSVQRRDEQIWQEIDNAEFFISLKKWIYTMGDMIGIFSFVVSCCSHIGARIGTVFARLATAFPSHKNRLPVVYDSGYLGGARMWGKNGITRRVFCEGGDSLHVYASRIWWHAAASVSE